jgi:hypothetical protein
VRTNYAGVAGEGPFDVPIEVLITLGLLTRAALMIESGEGGPQVQPAATDLGPGLSGNSDLD